MAGSSARRLLSLSHRCTNAERTTDTLEGVADHPSLLANRFRIDSLLAEGGMARVYRGTDRLLGRTVAIKVLAASLARDPSFVARFRREAMAAASLSHANVVSVFDTGSDGDFHYIVMEYVSGRSLAEVIAAAAPLDTVEAAGIAASVCQALAVAHGAGIVHRDVKPANIMIDDAGLVKVADFGIAKTSSDGLTIAGSVMGTVAYLSPEQAAGEAVDPRTDIYALGCVLYEMLTGRPPISGESLIEVAHKLSTYTPPSPSELNPLVPAALDEIVGRASAKEPAQRYPDAREMRRALQGMLQPGFAAAGTVGASFAGPLAPGPGPGAGLPGPRPGARPAAAGGGPEAEREVLERTSVLQGTGSPAGPAAKTRVLPGPGAAGPRKARFGLLLAGVVLLSAGAVAFVSGLGDSSSRSLNPELVIGEQPALPTTPPVATTEPPPEPSPPPTTTTLPSGLSVNPAVARAALSRLFAMLGDGEQSGVLTKRAARNVLMDLEQAQRQIEDGDYDDALQDLQDARSEIAKYLEREEIPPGQAAALGAAINQLAQAIGG
ncbi:MAG: protein kinase domain-containing protein [Actinomycetota bacterium]